MDTNFDLKLPLWGLEQKGKTDSWLPLSPFSNQVSFTKAGNQLMMQGSHEFNRFNQHQSFDVLLHAGTSPLWVPSATVSICNRSVSSVRCAIKVTTPPEGKKLTGATHIYLWGNTLLAPEDVKNWPGLIGYLQSAAGAGIWQHTCSGRQKSYAAITGART